MDKNKYFSKIFLSYESKRIDNWVVQRLQKGWLFDKWIDIKGFDTPEKAEELLNLLE